MGAIIISFIVLVFAIIFFPHFFRNTYKVIVINKQLLKHNNINEYLIYTQTEDGNIEVFQDTNDFFELKFNSGDSFKVMQINKEYEVVAYGLNIPSLSDYQNILKVKAIRK